MHFHDFSVHFSCLLLIQMLGVFFRICSTVGFVLWVCVVMVSRGTEKQQKTEERIEQHQRTEELSEMQ